MNRHMQIYTTREVRRVMLLYMEIDLLDPVRYFKYTTVYRYTGWNSDPVRYFKYTTVYRYTGWNFLRRLTC
jgi:hypothetical protein